MILAYTFKTKIGSMAIAWEGNKIVAVNMPEKSSAILLEKIRERFSAPELRWSKNAPEFISITAEKITKHLDGNPQKFSLKDLELEKTAPFHKKVYENTLRVPAGTVLTYGELAKKAGSPKASRAVGQAMAKNPFPIIIPCHRVVGGSGKLVGYSAHGGIETKKKILEIESSDNQS